jgi:hypothetical protein
LLAFVDGEADLFLTARNLVEQSKFAERQCIQGDMPGERREFSINTRRRRIAAVHNEIRKLVSDRTDHHVRHYGRLLPNYRSPAPGADPSRGRDLRRALTTPHLHPPSGHTWDPGGIDTRCASATTSLDRQTANMLDKDPLCRPAAQTLRTILTRASCTALRVAQPLAGILVWDGANGAVAPARLVDLVRMRSDDDLVQHHLGQRAPVLCRQVLPCR